MPETKNITFTHKEVVEALIRYNNIHEGLWDLYIEFGLAGANVGSGPGGDLNPAAIVPILKVGIQRTEKTTNLTVDAAAVNPLTVTPSKKI
jgi:hypothetical protein